MIKALHRLIHKIGYSHTNYSGAEIKFFKNCLLWYILTKFIIVFSQRKDKRPHIKY